MIETIQNIVPELQGRVRAGRLECRSTVETEAAVVFSKLQDFGGEGWACLTDNPVVVRFEQSKPLADTASTSRWIDSAEAADGAKSLHIARCAAGWTLTQIALADPQTPEDVIVESNLKARDGRADLAYETSWQLQEKSGVKEVRPVAFRFAGFAPKKEK